MTMHFNYKDLIKAPRLAFRFRSLWIGILGLSGYFLITRIFLFLAALFSDKSFSYLHYAMYLLKGETLLQQFSWPGKILMIVGFLAAFAWILLWSVTLARAIYMILRDEIFYTWLDALKWSMKKWISIIGTYFTFFVLLLLFILGALVMALIGKIPYIGSFITALFTIPYVLGGMLVLYFLLGLLVASVYASAIIATSDEDALGAVFQSFSSLASEPMRTFVYSLVIGIYNLFFSLLYILGLALGAGIFIGLFYLVAGESFLQMVIQSFLMALKVLGGSLPFILEKTFPAFFFSPGEVPFIPLILMTLSFLILLFSIAGYSFGISGAGATIAYTIISYKKDGENLLERKDDEISSDEEDENEMDEIDDDDDNDDDEDHQEKTEGAEENSDDGEKD